MKKFLTIFSFLLLWPISIFGYSEKIIPGGENIGITINTEGLVVIGFYKVDGQFIGKETLKVGDIILEIEGMSVENIKEMSSLIDKYVVNNKVNIKILRNDKSLNTTLSLIKEDNVYKTGLYVKESVTGIGTLTYIDPITKIYGSLGHEIVMNDTNKRVEVKSGNIFESFVNGIERSTEGKVGSKSASIKYSKNLGTITQNTSVGLFGIYTSLLPSKDLMEVAKFEDIELGEAYIYTNIKGNEIKTYKINIISLNKSKINTSKSISFKIEDSELMSDTGGVVQGMSGSPIIQNNKIIGAVTHVVVSSPNEGYGIFIRTMLEKGEN